MKESDTIAAIATPSGHAGIGVIRISGSKAFETADRIIRSGSGNSLNLNNQKSHTIHYGFVYDNEDCIDEVLVSLFRAPRSYTMEDTVEISCHGGMYILDRILQTILSHDVRLAEPGEFTKRAFLNGRIDLTKAESVMDLISSKNEFARKNSLRHLKGSLYELICKMRESLIHEVAYIEAALDDPEHYDLSDHNDILKEKISGLLGDIDRLIKDSENAGYYQNGIRVVIVGKPNAGKSSLLNLLVGFEKAIVTGEEGTTRDAVEETVSVDGIVLRLIDTAGIRNSENEAEQIGILRSKKYIDQADLILYVADSSRMLDENDYEIISLIKDHQTIILLNKSDLIPVTTGKDFTRKCKNVPVITVSALNGNGIDLLLDQIRKMFYQNKISDNSNVFVTNIRQLNYFKKARESLFLAMRGIDQNMTEDVLTIDLMDAYERLGSVIGESLEDDLADRIFSEFCMGK